MKFNKITFIFFLLLLFSLANFNFGIFTGGDNAVYLILAKSLAKFGEYRDLYLPGSPLHTKYPPFYPLILSIFYFFFGENYIIPKFLNVIFYISSIYFFYKILKEEFKGDEYLNKFLPIFILLLGMNPVLLDYSHWILSEIPFLFFTLVSLYLFYLYQKKEDKKFLILSLFFGVFSYLTKIIGLALLLGYSLYFLTNKKYKLFLICSLFLLIPFLLWNSWVLSKGENIYLKQLFLKNPYSPEEGKINFFEFLTRFFKNLLNYSTWIMGSLFFDLKFKNLSTWSGLSSFFLITVGLIRGKCLKKRVILFYFVFYLIPILSWPEVWADKRFLIPLFPFMFFYFFQGIIHLLSFLRNMKIKNSLLYVFLFFVGFFYLTFLPFKIQLVWYKNLEYLKGDILAPYKYPFKYYFKIAIWAKNNIEENSLFLTRKPALFYLFSERKCIKYPYTKNAEKLEKFIKKYEIDYIVFAPLSNQDTEFLLPFIEQNKNEFKLIYKPYPDVYLLKVIKHEL